MTVASPSIQCRPFAAITVGIVLRAAPGRLLAFEALFGADPATVAPYYLQFFDRTTAPVTTVTVPTLSFIIAPTDVTAVVRATPPDRLIIGANELSPQGRPFGTGITYGLSSTPAVFTVPGGGIASLELSTSLAPYEN